MRLLIYIHSLEAGGAERVSANLANHWATKGWEITIVTVRSRSADFYALDKNVGRIALELDGSSSNWLAAARVNLKCIRALRRILQEVQPDVALAMMSNANVTLGLASRGLPGLCAIGAEHIYPPQIPLGRSWELLRRLVYGQLYAVTALTSEGAAWIKENTVARHVPVIPNTAGWPLPEQMPKILPSERCGPGRKILLAVGRLSPQKNAGILIEAFIRLVPAHPDWDLVILGNGPEREALETQVRNAGLEKRIRLPGVVGNIAAWYEHADLYVMSSRFEGFPNTLAEAMAHGLPAVSFDCDTGPRDIIRDGIDGLLVPPGDTAGLIAALKRLMDDSALRKDYALRATDARDRFSIERISAMWEELFKQGLSKRARTGNLRASLDPHQRGLR